MLGDARMDGGFLTGVPDGFIRDRSILVGLADAAGEKIDARLLPPPILAQRFQQSRAEWQISTVAALAALDANHHAPAVDIAHLEHRHFCPPHARAVKRHQQSTLQEVAGGIDKPGNLLQTQHRRQPARRLRVGQLLSELASLERSNEEESERRNPGHHACHRQLALNEQIRLIAS